jgi:hypothetical protein
MVTSLSHVEYIMHILPFYSTMNTILLILFSHLFSPLNLQALYELLLATFSV